MMKNDKRLSTGNCEETQTGDSETQNSAPCKWWVIKSTDSSDTRDKWNWDRKRVDRDTSLLRGEGQGSWIISLESSDNWPEQMSTNHSLSPYLVWPQKHEHRHTCVIQLLKVRHDFNYCVKFHLGGAALNLDLIQGSLSLFSGTKISNSITPPISSPPLPMQRIHYNGTGVSHFSLNKGFACLRSLFQPSHADGFLRPVICPIQVIGHPVHSYALNCVDSWEKHILLVRSLLLQHTWKHYRLESLFKYF